MRQRKEVQEVLRTVTEASIPFPFGRLRCKGIQAYKHRQRLSSADVSLITDELADGQPESSSARPVGTEFPDVDVGEALSGVNAHAAPVGHQFSCVGRHRCRGLALHGNVSRRAVAVLAVGRAAHLGVVLRRPVGAVDDHRGGKMAADALQDHHQPGGGQNGVTAVLAGKFFYGEVGGQLFAAVLRFGIGVDLDHRPLSFRFFGFFAFQLPDR